ncbi:MAG TPA: hypothetical protein VGK64_14035 [Bryobacteraceae bacterium]
MSHIPDVSPIGVVIEIACLTMAGATQRTDLNSREPARILNRSLAGRFGVRTSGAVAGFTMNAGFARLNLEAVTECYWSSRVTAETAQRGFYRVKSAIDQAGIGGVTGRKP